MAYHGGKHRNGPKIAKELIKSIESEGPYDYYIEPFCGFMGVSRHLQETLKKYKIKSLLSDGSEDLILLWSSIKNNTFDDPGIINQEQWTELKNNKEKSVLKTFAGFAYSFGGIWFSGNKIRDDPERDARRYQNIIDRNKNIIDYSTIEFKDYKNCLDSVPTNSKCLIYLDPPYHLTRCKYPTATKFDYQEFLNKIKEWSDQGHTIYVSETFLDIGTCILEIGTMNMKSNKFVDKLFKI